MEKETKKKTIKKLNEFIGEELIAIFYALGLKDGIETLMVNDANGDEFVLSFFKVKNNNILASVSNRRELLIAFLKKVNQDFDIGLPHEGMDEYVEEFLK